jgi:YVTN family beta-propeller protein
MAARIYSVNPDNDTVAALDAGTLAKLWEVPVGKEPRSLAVGPDGRVWVVRFRLRTNWWC